MPASVIFRSHPHLNSPSSLFVCLSVSRSLARSFLPTPAIPAFLLSLGCSIGRRSSISDRRFLSCSFSSLEASSQRQRQSRREIGVCKWEERRSGGAEERRSRGRKSPEYTEELRDRWTGFQKKTGLEQEYSVEQEYAVRCQALRIGAFAIRHAFALESPLSWPNIMMRFDSSGYNDSAKETCVHLKRAQCARARDAEIFTCGKQRNYCRAAGRMVRTKQPTTPV